MKNIFLILIVSISFIFLSCESDKPKEKKFTMNQLEKNNGNKLAIETIEKPDLMALNQKLSESEKGEIEKMLEKNGLNFFEASYGLHYLGNRYFAEDNFEKGMYYQHLAADEYLNPLAMLRLAIIYSKTREEILSKLPKGTKLNFDRDYNKSFRYMRWAINISILTMEYFEDRSVLDDINKFGSSIIDLYERRDSSLLKDFDIEAAEELGKKELPAIKEAFIKVYKPKKKMDEKVN